MSTTLDNTELQIQSARFVEQINFLTQNVKDIAQIVKNLQNENVRLVNEQTRIKGYATGFMAAVMIVGSGFIWSAEQQIIGYKNYVDNNFKSYADQLDDVKQQLNVLQNAHIHINSGQ
jgi:hypothetical protein